MGIDEPLPAGLYTQPEAFQRERRSVFGSTWLLLARADALQKPGDYVAQSLGGWPVFAMMDAGGARRALRNVCRHQKLPLFDTGAGHCEQVRCRYHGWTYDTAGHFVSAPPQAAPSGELSRDLEPVATAQIHGLLFVHLGDDPPVITDALPSLAPALAEARLDTRGFQAETTTDIDANWKLVMEEALADRGVDLARSFAWPCLILDSAGDGAVLHQVIPRSFHRTRIHHLSYGTAVGGAADRWKAGAIARHVALEAGAAPQPPISPELEAFRRRLRAAHADGGPNPPAP
ncbi:MAG TPA: Rieske 2Fe-2S domain-containing protein [Stellaceae bacterium]|nr:Rieske 2Fe-2S domain-containing protein [Stellaceae bacterium]